MGITNILFIVNLFPTVVGVQIHCTNEELKEREWETFLFLKHFQDKIHQYTSSNIIHSP